MRVLFLFAVVFAGLLHAEIVDRIVAVVDGRVITWSGALAEANYQAFRKGEPPVTTLGKEPLYRIVSQMIDQILLEREKENSPFTATDRGDVQHTLAGIRKRFPKPGEYEKALKKYRLTEAGLVRHLKQESTILAFVDYHLRPQVQLAPDAVETYYKQTLLPELQRQGQIQPPPLAEVSGKIEQILVQRQINRLLEGWLQQLRGRAKIKLMLGSQ